MDRPTITAILNAHREGMLAKPSLQSLSRSIADAETAAISVETIIVLDRADQLTREVVHQHAGPEAKIIETSFGDPGKARNRAVEEAKGRYLAFLDADDLWGVNWLSEAARHADGRTDPVIWHPEVCAYFGGAKHLFRHIDMEDEDFRPSGLMIENYWTMLSFGDRRLYLENPYPETDLKAGFGFEDWGWNMNTISRGIIHKIVPGTGHAIRRRPHSVSANTVNAQAVPAPSHYIRSLVQKSRP